MLFSIDHFIETFLTLFWVFRDRTKTVRIDGAIFTNL
jgi:hypothetical protein